MSDSFGVLVYEYLKTLVPHWRLSDEAWLLGNEHLIGIGVERNYGGQLMVVPYPDGPSVPHPSWLDLEPALKAAGIAPDRVVVVVNDRDGRGCDWQSTSFVQVLWSERERLKDYVLKPTLNGGSELNGNALKKQENALYHMR